jgi:hypothetical protein
MMADGSSVPELEAADPAFASRVAQLSIMVDAFLMQHGIVQDEECDLNM